MGLVSFGNQRCSILRITKGNLTASSITGTSQSNKLVRRGLFYGAFSPLVGCTIQLGISRSDLSTADGGVREGFLLLTLKNYSRVYTDTFIGEAVVPLSSLPCADASQEHAGPICLAMTSPSLDIGKF